MMRLYSGLTCPFSQRCRIVLIEKGMDYEIESIDTINNPKDLSELNPYNQVPILEDRDLVLYESNVINMYLDERFPHPQLMPLDPAMRARARLFLHIMGKEIFDKVQILEDTNETKKNLDNARVEIATNLLKFTTIFDKFPRQKYLQGDTFSIVDVALAPLLWRLDYYGISLGGKAASILKYAERVFQRESFIKSLTPAELAMRK